MEKKILYVVCAIIVSEGRFFLARRPENKDSGGLWEFPGGKVDEGETYQEAIVREIKEELSLDVVAHQVYPSVVKTNDLGTIELIPIRVLAFGYDVELTEHSDYKWCDISDADSMSLCPGDEEILQMIKDGVIICQK